MDEGIFFSNDGQAEEQQPPQSDDERDQEPETSHQDYESDASTDSDDGGEKCPICLLTFSQEIGRPLVCQHVFCFPCIDEWSKVMKTCPIDRREFSQIEVFDNSVATAENLLRTVTVNENISIKEYTGGVGEQEYTPCEICRRVDREDVMLLCDGCDKGFHMDCLDPPMQVVPINNWHCAECENRESNSSSEESNDEDIVNEDNDHALRDQPQILRTRQSERIRNAILARRSIRGALHAIQCSEALPSTSRAISSSTAFGVSRVTAQTVKKAPAKKRRKKTRRAKRVTEVIEYEIRDGQKFPTVKRTRVVRTKKRRKNKRDRRAAGEKLGRPGRKGSSACASTSIAAGFKGLNSNVYDLQRGRQLAGLGNFNIFEPSNLLDYVPDDDFSEELSDYQRAGSTLTQSIVNYTNPLRKQALIKKRVLVNCTSTSNEVNLLDSILNEQDCFVTSRTFGQKPSAKLISSTTANSLAMQSTGEGAQELNGASSQSVERGQREENEAHTSEVDGSGQAILSDTSLPNNSNNSNEQQQTSLCEVDGSTKLSLKKEKKKRAFDMFDDDSPPEDPEENQGQSEVSNCPNFSIYDSVNRKSDENLANQRKMVSEEMVDLVQMSDDGDHNMSEDAEPAVVRSQPASPDLENDPGEQAIEEEDRSYTPPIVVQKEREDDEMVEREKEKSKRDRDHRKHKRRDMERYNVRERFRERSGGGRHRDRFGRNRTRSRSRSRSRQRSLRKRSRSSSRFREKNHHRRSRSKNAEKPRRRSHSRSLSSRRDSSNEQRKKDKRGKHSKKSNRRSRSQSPSRYHRDKSPRRRRERSPSEKPKKKKQINRSNEKSATHTKEVFTSGQNILVSVNFSSQADENRSGVRPEQEKGTEPVVDITAKKKINVSSKSVVAIIDLARSPFRELTPEYKKESNVIELSDSDGEKQQQRPPKSPDSTKLYDPFDILNSPTENVSSSQQNISVLKAISSRDIPGDFTNKLGANIIKNLPQNANSEENLVSSSSSVNAFDKLFSQAISDSKIEVIQSENTEQHNSIIESPYSPGNDEYPSDDHVPSAEDSQMKTIKTGEKDSANDILDELFGSSSPPPSQENVKKIKNAVGKKTSLSSSSDPSKYLTKLKRQERVIEEVKLVIKPYYSKRMINKEQYKEIMRKAVPKICHNRSGEINPAKIKHLIDSYVKMYAYKRKRPEPEEIF